MTTYRADINPLEQPEQLFGGQFHHGPLPERPDEAVFFETLHHWPEAIAVPAEQLDAIVALVAERE